MEEWQWHIKSELEDGGAQSNETCPAVQEWHNKLLMGKRGEVGSKESREEKGKRKTGAASGESNKECPVRSATTRCSGRQRDTDEEAAGKEGGAGAKKKIPGGQQSKERERGDKQTGWLVDSRRCQTAPGRRARSPSVARGERGRRSRRGDQRWRIDV